jgi:hypothetical protein
VKIGENDRISNRPEDRTQPDAWPSTGTNSLCPRWSSADSVSHPQAARPPKTRAIHTISTHPTPKPSAISTVPLCSALFRQKIFLPHPHVVRALGGSGQLPSNQNLPHAATHATSSNERHFALPLLGERAGVRGGSVRAAQSLSTLQRPLFNFVQVCSGLFNLNFFPKKSHQPGNVDSPPSGPRPVHTGSHSFTLVHNKKTFQKFPRSFFKRFRSHNLSFEISSFLWHLLICHLSFTSKYHCRRAALSLPPAPTLFLPVTAR